MNKTSRSICVRASLMLVVLLGLASTALAQSGFDGKWAAEVVRPAPAGNQTLAITLKTAEGKVSGSMMISGVPQEASIDWGMVKGDLITFKVKMPFQNNPTTFVYIGKIDGDQILFGRRPEDLTLGRLVEFTAKRAR
jgi:hypothetical protein